MKENIRATKPNQEQQVFATSKKNYGTEQSTTSKASSSAIYSPLAQLWACFGKYVCMINVGLVGSFPVLAIPFMTSGTFRIKMTESELEWMVSILYITMAIGSCLSALPYNCNHKVPMMVAQGVMMISWIITFFANYSWQLIMARAIGGISMTLSLPQVQAYIGEVTAPHLRGIFGSLTQTMIIMGQFVMSGLTYLNSWDKAVFISGCLPLIAICYLFFIPESPVMLVKKKKYKKGWAELKKLRGWKWANENEMIEEFRQIQKYCDNKINKNPYSKNINHANNRSSVSTADTLRIGESPIYSVTCIEETYKKLNNNVSDYQIKNLLNYDFDPINIYAGVDNPTFEDSEVFDQETGIVNFKNQSSVVNSVDRAQENKRAITIIDNKEFVSEESLWRFLLMPEMYKPTLLMLVCSFFIISPGADSIFIFLQWYINDFHIQVDYSILLSLLTGATLVGNLFSVCCVSKLGKRNIILLATVCAGVGYIGLTLLYYYKQDNEKENMWLFSIILIWIFFMEEFGIRTIYHSLMSEVFPLRGKKIGPMIIILMLCLNGFLVMSNLPSIFSSFGTIYVIIFDIVLNFLGAAFFYVYLFETEGKTLGEIENSFRSEKKEKLAKRNSSKVFNTS